MIVRRIKAYLVKNGIKQNWLVAELRKGGINISESKLSAILNESRPLWSELFAAICIALNVDANLFIKD